MAFAVPLVIAVGFELGAVAIAGAALTAVGGLTKNEDMMKVGGLITLGSAFAGMATGGSALAGEAAGEVAGEAGVMAAADAADAAQGQAFLSGAEAAPQTMAEAVVQGTDPATAAVANGPDVVNAPPPSSPAEASLAADSTAANALNPAGQTGSLANPAQNMLEDPFAVDGAQGSRSAGMELKGQQGIIEQIMNPAKEWLGKQGDFTKAAMVKAGADFVAGGLKRDANGEYVDLQGRKLSIEEAEQARKIANVNNVGQVSVNMAPKPGANLYPTGTRYVPKVGLINRMA